MATFHYWYMFRVADVGDDNKRRQSIYDAIIAQNPNGARWAEPTSSGLIESELTVGPLVQRLTRGLNGAVDLFIASDLHAPQATVYFGKVEYPAVLKHFLPQAVKLT